MWTQLSYGTIMIWFDRLREICSEIIRPQDHGRQARTRMIGDAEIPIQIQDWMSPENHEGNIDGPWIMASNTNLITDSSPWITGVGRCWLTLFSRIAPLGHT